MENYPQLITLIILIPSVAAFINMFWGARLPERAVGWIATVASGLAFLIAILLYSYLSGSGYQSVIVNPPFLDGWITMENAGVSIPWQLRVDTLSVTMMLVITGVGTLIHLYSISYMHGDERYHRYFTYLSMFLAFMLVLVTGNNFLMMFVGWEGVGVCSFLLIGFWFDRSRGIGWRNSNAARKAFIANRVGDFGLMLGLLLIFWTFGTLDYYTPGELANPHFVEEQVHEEEAAGEGGAAEAEAAHKIRSVLLQPEEGEEEGEVGAIAEGEGEEGVSEAEHSAEGIVYINNDHIVTEQLGVFGQAERMLEEDRQIQVGPMTVSISTMIGLITFFLLIGATGKSAQIPLFVWLPDAMAGPTPASALIHAATMVTAGVYMMVRSNVLFYNSDAVSFLVTIIGASTALVGGFIALGQWDIKRVLAYSTVSQLGFMVAAVGVGAYGAAMFHLVTHAFFKALLFLGSGSVIHAIEHGHHSAHARSNPAPAEHDGDDHAHDDEFDPQDMRNMGGLSRKMPFTYITYLAGTLALAGIFPFAGFWSKDEILADSWLAGIVDNKLGGYLALGMLLLAAGLTAFYMWRQIVLVFHGGPRTEAADHAPESAPLMVIPLVVLGVLSLIGGFLNVPSNVLGLDGIFGAHRFTTWLEASVLHAHAADFQPLIAIGALAVAIGAIIVANGIYARNRDVETGRDPLQANPNTASVFNLANARLYWDHIYTAVLITPYRRVAEFLADTVDQSFLHDYFHDVILFGGYKTLSGFLAGGVDVGIIDGIVNGVARLTKGLSGGMRRVQTGYVRVYAITLLLGVVVVILVLLLPLIQGGVLGSE